METLKPRPSIKALAILSSFLMPANSKISSKIGKIITNKTDGEINKPKNKTPHKNKITKQFPLFFANFKSINDIAILLMIDVLERAYVQTKVKSKNINVEFPKLEENALENPTLSKKAKEIIQSKLGQSMPIVSHKNKQLRKIKITPVASIESELDNGINFPKKHKAKQIGILTQRKILLFFNCIYQSSFVIYRSVLKYSLF